MHGEQAGVPKGGCSALCCLKTIGHATLILHNGAVLRKTHMHACMHARFQMLIPFRMH